MPREHVGAGKERLRAAARTEGARVEVDRAAELEQFADTRAVELERGAVRRDVDDGDASRVVAESVVKLELEGGFAVRWADDEPLVGTQPQHRGIGAAMDGVRLER